MDSVIVKSLKEIASEEKRVGLMRFFKTGKGQYGEGDEFLGIKVPQTREIVCKYWEEYDLCGVDELVTSKYHEVRLAGLLVLVKMYRHAMRHDKTLSDKIAAYYLAHTAYINNWDLVDLSCYYILGYWLLDHPEKMELLNKLAKSKNMWEQRIAMVSTMQLLRHGNLEKTYEIADLLLHHEHDLIHKAVGWLLREAGKRDRARLEDFLKPRYKKMPRTMLRYAIEKFPEDLRKRYLVGEV